jgi:hypothetical protein
MNAIIQQRYNEVTLKNNRQKLSIRNDAGKKSVYNIRYADMSGDRAYLSF